MREKLKEFNWHIHGLSERDLEKAIKLTKNLIGTKKKELKKEEKKIRKENPDFADDILDDISYYAWIDMQILWQFCLWRLQSIFEGIITTRLLSDEETQGLAGLKKKLDKLQSVGYRISQKDYDELLEWSRLRNALSHCPPEHYRPISLKESDIEEYLDLIMHVTQDLSIQKRRIEVSGSQEP